MAYDIGPRIGIKGEPEFELQIKTINNSLRECGSEMKALSSEFEDNANSQDALIAKNKNLQKEMDLQRQKMNLLYKYFPRTFLLSPTGTAGIKKREMQLSRTSSSNSFQHI